MKIRLFTIPNILTLCNLLCGSVAVLFALRFDDIQISFYLIIAAAIFDFLDGFVARLLKSYSPVGKELDSLADVISFGMAPSSILFSMYQLAGGTGWWGYAVFILAAFSALRLAKFNIDENQAYGFIGMPTPAAALFVSASGYLFAAGLYILNPYYTIGIAVVLSYFLVSNIPMFALKFTHYGFKGNELRYTFCLLSIVCVILWGIVAIPFIIMAYVLVSVIRRFFVG